MGIVILFIFVHVHVQCTVKEIEPVTVNMVNKQIHILHCFTCTCIYITMYNCKLSFIIYLSNKKHEKPTE